MRQNFFALTVAIVAAALLLPCQAQEKSSCRNQHATVRPSPLDGPYTLQAINDTPTQKWLHEVLDKPVPAIDIPGEVSLKVVLKKLAEKIDTRHGLTHSGQFSMVFVPDRGQLGVVGIDTLDDIKVFDVKAEGAKLRSVLSQFLSQTEDRKASPVPLDYIIVNEAIMITTRDRVRSGGPMYTRAYRVDALQRSIAAANASLSSGAVESHSLTNFLVEATDGELKWRKPAAQSHPDDLAGGTILMVGHTMVVKQNHNGHRRIVELLNLLTAAEAVNPREPAVLTAIASE